MFKIYFINFGYTAEPSFAKLEDAIAYAKSKGFEAAIMQNKLIVGSWSFFSGYKDAQE